MDQRPHGTKKRENGVIFFKFFGSFKIFIFKFNKSLIEDFLHDVSFNYILK